MNHPDGRSRAMFFTRFCFQSNIWKILAKALKKQGENHAVVKVVDSDFGLITVNPF